MRNTYTEKREWILAQLQEKWEYECRTHCGSDHIFQPSICASDEEESDAWFARFGGKQVIYTLGPCICPDFARTLRRMFKEGLLVRGTNGNQDARYYCQKTYYVFYKRKNPFTKE